MTQEHSEILAAFAVAVRDEAIRQRCPRCIYLNPDKHNERIGYCAKPGIFWSHKSVPASHTCAAWEPAVSE